LSFVFSLQAAGIAIFLVVFADALDRDLVEGIRRPGSWSAMSAAMLVLLHYGLESARMAGDLAGVWDLSLQHFVATSNTAVAAGLRVTGLLLVAAYLRRTTETDGSTKPQGGGELRPASAAASRGWPRPPALAWLGAALIAASFAAMGHTAASSQRWLLAGLLLVHLLVIEFWFGALLPLIQLTRSAAVITAPVILRFSRIATALVPLIAVAGLAMAYVLIPKLGVLGEPYGQLLLAKGAGFTVLMALATLNKWSLGPNLESGGASAARRLRRSMTAEYVLLAAVLVITAVMTSFFSPE
jgi:hypothetical protein